MIKVIIIGASGGLVPAVVDAINKIGEVEITLFLRKRTRLPKSLSTGYAVIEGDAMNPDDLRNAISGKEIVYVNLAGDLEPMTRNIVAAMKINHVGRIIAISAIGIYDMPPRPILIPYRKLADVIEESGLDYTILRPDWFTDANEVDYAITTKGKPESGHAISRKSIAAFVATIIRNPQLHKKENLGISKP